jgi:DNA-binding beta-propeller fold protein YncE
VAAGLVAGLVFAAAASAADTPALELVQTITWKGKKGTLDHLVLDAKHDRLLVAYKANNTLDIVDLKAGKLLRQVPGQSGVQGLAYAADLNRVFAALGTGGYCNVLDGDTYRTLKTIKFTDDADNVRYNPRTHRVYVAHAENELGVIDAKAMAKIAEIKLPGSAEAFQLEAGRPRLYLNVPSPSQVVVIDTDKNEVAQSYPLTMAKANFPLVLDEAEHRLFIGCRKDPKVIIMDSESGKEITSVPIKGDTDDLYYDAKRKRLYASCGDGFLTVIKQVDADNYEVLEDIPTAQGARTCFYEPVSGRLYLLVPRQEGQEGPELRIYQARP